MIMIFFKIFFLISKKCPYDILLKWILKVLQIKIKIVIFFIVDYVERLREFFFINSN